MSMGCLINDGMNILKVGTKEKSEEEDDEEEEENFHFRQALGIFEGRTENHLHLVRRSCPLTVMQGPRP